MERSRIELYRFNSDPDPITIAVRAWVVFCEIKGYEEHVSGYNWNAAGELPVLLYKHHVIVKDKIIDFLRLVYDLDEDVQGSDRETSELIQEICYSRLHPSTMFALWMEEETQKDFYSSKGSIFEWLVCGPANKIRFSLEKNRVREYLNKQHGIRLSEDAFNITVSSFSCLSRLLGSKLFFCSSHFIQEYPRSADIIAYAYISYQLKHLKGHKFVTNSLMMHQNLIEFIERVENSMRLKIKAGLSELNGLDFVTIEQKGYEEYFCTKVYANPLEVGNEAWNRLVYKLGGDEPEERKDLHENIETKIKITGIAIVLFLFTYFRN